MERMMDLEEMLRELSEKYKNSKSVEVYEEDLEGWFKIIDDLREENKNLNIKVASLEGEIKGLNSVIDKLKEENQYREDIADVLPEGEGHIAEETIQDLQARIKELKKENETLKEELISRIRQPQNTPYGKGVAELMEEDTLQELRDIGKI